MFTSVSRRQAENLQKPEVEIRPCVPKIHYCGKNTLLWQISLPGKEKLWQTLYFACCWLFGPRPAALPLRSGVAVPRQVERFLIFLRDFLQHLWNKSLAVSTGVSLASQIIRTAHPTLGLLNEVLLMWCRWLGHLLSRKRTAFQSNLPERVVTASAAAIPWGPPAPRSPYLYTLLLTRPLPFPVLSEFSSYLYFLSENLYSFTLPPPLS